VPLVSILIPAFNAARWVGAAIESALTQTWREVEVIVVDDGSRDDTLAVARRHASERVRVFSQPNRGAAAARNRALLEARGTVIQYLDADDLLAPEKIARQLERLEPDVLCSGQWGPFYGDPARARFTPDALQRDLDPVEWLVTAWTGGLMMQPAAWLAHRELLERAGPWDERLTLDDDGEYFTRVLLRSREVRFCAGARVFYRVGNTASLSWRGSAAAVRSHHLSATLSTERLLARENSPRTRQAAGAKLMSFVYASYPTEKPLVADGERRIQALGLSPPPVPRGGPLFRVLSRVLGWKRVKSLRQPYYQAKVRISRMLERA